MAEVGMSWQDPHQGAMDSLVHKKIILTVHPDGNNRVTTGFTIGRVIAQQGDVLLVWMNESQDDNRRTVIEVNRKYAHVLRDDEPEPEMFSGLKRFR